MEPRQTLCDLIATHGHGLCDDIGRCESFLRDYCPHDRGKVNILINALKEGVATELLRCSVSFPRELLFGRLSLRLEEHYGMRTEMATWAVETWELALRTGGAKLGVQGDLSTQNANRNAVFTPAEMAKAEQGRLEACPIDAWQKAMEEELAAHEEEEPRAQPHRLAVNQGNADAQAHLGLLYLSGEGLIAKDEAEAVKCFLLAAAQGHAGAQYQLGRCFCDAKGVAKNDGEAVKWFRSAADQGHGEAQAIMGSCYSQGFHVAKDETEAVKWFRLAAAQDHAVAQYLLGYSYCKAKGVGKDDAEAVNWFRLAANQGHSDAQVMLGHHYANGEGVAKDNAEAAKWYRKAADQGDANGQLHLGDCYSLGKGLVQDDAEAVKWLRLAAEQGDTMAQWYMGIFYAYGSGVVEDEVEAARWFRLAAAQGSAEAQYDLGSCYFEAKGVTENHDEAVKWFRLAADQGESRAQSKLGHCYTIGAGVMLDEAEAQKWYRLAADQGDPAAQDYVGQCYECGKGVAEDAYAALKWYRMAADQGLASAQFKLGVSSANGQGMAVDKPQALKWLRLAAEQGHQAALLMMNSLENADLVTSHLKPKLPERIPDAQVGKLYQFGIRPLFDKDFERVCEIKLTPKAVNGLVFDTLKNNLYGYPVSPGDMQLVISFRYSDTADDQPDYIREIALRVIPDSSAIVNELPPYELVEPAQNGQRRFIRDVLGFPIWISLLNFLWVLVFGVPEFITQGGWGEIYCLSMLFFLTTYALFYYICK